MPREANQTSFKKGNKAALGNQNRKGIPGYTREERDAILMDRIMFRRYLIINCLLSTRELRSKIRKKNCNALEAIIIRALLKGGETGDVYAFDKLMDWLVGKVV